MNSSSGNPALDHGLIAITAGEKILVQEQGPIHTLIAKVSLNNFVCKNAFVRYLAINYVVSDNKDDRQHERKTYVI